MVYPGFKQKELQKLLTDIGFIVSDYDVYYERNQLFMNQRAGMFALNSFKLKI
ncbi:hypothetical protein ACWOAH_05430 [Vagococcus vulneris]